MMAEAPLFASVAEGPPDGRAYWLETADSVRIRVAHWGADAPGGTVLLFPGRTEYVEKYGRAAAEFRARGLATLTVDWRGQGMATRLGPRPAIGHVARFRDYQHDVAALVAHARAAGLPQPWFLVAHSMGGAIGLRALIEGLPVQAAVFTGPMWGITIPAYKRPVAWGLSALSRPLRFGHAFPPGSDDKSYVLHNPFDGNSLTSDREMYDYMRRQIAAHPDLSLGGPSLIWLNESLREMRALATARSPGVPALTFLGTDESIVDPGRIRQRMARWQGGELVVVPGARHEVLMETPPTRRMVFDRTAALFARVA